MILAILEIKIINREWRCYQEKLQSLSWVKAWCIEGSARKSVWLNHLDFKKIAVGSKEEDWYVELERNVDPRTSLGFCIKEFELYPKGRPLHGFSIPTYKRKCGLTDMSKKYRASNHLPAMQIHSQGRLKTLICIVYRHHTLVFYEL